MKPKNESKLEQVKQFLQGNGLFITEFPNGQLQVDKVNLWVTSEKWHDPLHNVKGVGVNSFIEYVTGQGKGV